MSIEIITTILTSSIIASLISGMIAFFQFKKNNQLVFITGERQKWREDIRSIADRIVSSKSFEDMENVLVDLKVRINAYGRNSGDVMQDSHIWNVIDKLEKHDEEYEAAKKLLILYLSTLLKTDWERSKAEVQGNGYQMAMYFFVICGEISFAYNYFITLHLFLDFLFVLASLILIYPAIMPPRTGMDMEMALEHFKKNNSFINNFCKNMSIAILSYIGVTVLVCFLNHRMDRIHVFFLSMFLLFLAFMVRFLLEHRRYIMEVYYYQNILLCKKRAGIQLPKDMD